MEYHNFTLKNYYHQEVVDYQKTLDEAISQSSIVKPMIVDIAEEIHTRMSKDENILFEGAQGALLDIDQGNLSLCNIFKYHFGWCCHWFWNWCT